MPEHSTAAPSRSVAKPLRIYGGFKPFGPGRVSILEATGAGEGIRTLDPNLGKVVLYP